MGLVDGVASLGYTLPVASSLELNQLGEVTANAGVFQRCRELHHHGISVDPEKVRGGLDGRQIEARLGEALCVDSELGFLLVV